MPCESDKEEGIGVEKIGKYQLAAMIILFQVGSNSMFQLGSKAMQDSWLSMLLVLAIGLVFLWIFLSVQRQAPEDHLVQMLTKHFGKWIGGGAAVAYAIYFAYQAMRNVRDFGDLMVMVFLARTPMSLIMLIFTLLSGYAAYKGVEVFFRAVEFMLPFVLLSYGILVILFLSSGVLHTGYLLPVLEHGFAPVLTAVPPIVMFPFAQMVVFLMFWQKGD